MDTAGVGVFSIDFGSGEMVWNRQMFLIHGLPEGQAAPRWDTFLAERVHPDDRANVARSGRASTGVEAVLDAEIRILLPDGSIRWVEYRSRADPLAANRRVCGVVFDVTDRVRQRAAADQSQRESDAAQREPAASAEFFARMSHELRTPLNAVLGFAQLIEEGGPDVPIEVQRERVGHIRNAGEKLLALIDDLLERVQHEALTHPGPLAALSGIATDSGEPATAASPADTPRTLNVLYIEDNPVNVILVEQLVAMRADTRLTCAADGTSGVALAVSQRPDVVLVDIQLPDIDGFEVLRRLRDDKALDRTAIIALSANGIGEDIALARAAGFDDYWTKPIDFRRFLRGLDRLAASRGDVAPRE